MDDETANDKPADRSSLSCNTPNIAAADQSCRDETQTPHLVCTAGMLALEDLSVATGQVRDESAAKILGSANTEGTPCHFMKLPAEVRLVIYEYHFQNILDNIEPKLAMRKSKTSKPHYVRAFKQSEVIKRALYLLQINRTMRIEALPVCTTLSETLYESIEAELDQLGSIWKYTATEILNSLMGYKNLVPVKPRDPRCSKLETRFDDVCEIRFALQLVTSNVLKKELEISSAKCRRKRKDCASLPTIRALKFWGLEKDELRRFYTYHKLSS